MVDPADLVTSDAERRAALVAAKLRALVGVRWTPGADAESRGFPGGSALVDRAAAHRAGLGWFGKNANLLLPGRGSWFVLGTVLTDADVVVDEPAAVVFLANLAALELHTPQWRIADQPSQPFPVDGRILADQVVVDLDPGPGVTMSQTATAALEVANELAAEGLLPVAKTSGGKGLQVLAAIQPTPADRVVEQVRRLAVSLSQRFPDRFVAVQARDRREGRILIDWLQNQPVRNTISVYSLRGRERPTVSTPLTWEEVGAATHGAVLDFSPADVLARVARVGDLAADLLASDRPPLRDLPDQSRST